jgi:HRDC domain
MMESMTAPSTSSSGQTLSSGQTAPIPLETLLAQAHAQPGEPQARLSQLLSALEDADWTLLLGGQEALAAQLAALLGPGLIRLDPRLSLNRELFAAFGLALASSDGEWKGARAVWLMEPDERSLARARKADVPLIADATLAPGGRWLDQGAQLVVYRDAVTLTGYADVVMSSVAGLGDRPRRAAAGPADLGVALALRDIGTLALRMNRRTRNAETLLPRFEGRALPVSGGVLLLEHDGPSTVTPLGGTLSAAQAVPAGTLVTVGIEAPDDAWAVLGAVLTGNGGLESDEKMDSDESLSNNEAPAETQSVPQASAAPDQNRRMERPERERGASRDASSRSAEAQATAPPSAPLPAGPMPTEAAQAPASESAAESEPGDFSDREFVFSPPPVLPDLPSLPSVVSLPDVANLPDDDGRPAKRGRNRRGKQAEAVAPVVPEIVMSESFSRPPEALPEEVARPDEQPADQWPEEVAGAETVLTGTQTAAETLPLQLPPDLPTTAQAAATDGLTEAEQAIFARLREWRNAEAKRQAVSSFIIASNATLAEVARVVPHTEADLKAVRGMGPERLRKYGEKILEVVRG